MKNVEELVKKYEAEVVKHYQWLHAHPELSGQEKETAAYIAAQLRKLGLEPVENVGGYGVVAVIQGKCAGKCIGLRADFDALPITECTGLPFASQNPGVMHACGHDAHTAMLLGVAMVLLELRDTFDGCVKLIFQPSEENSADSGAKKMIADGVLENPRVDAIIGQHIHAERSVGTVVTRVGVDTAASDRFFITIEGKSSHAASPNNGIDAIAVSAQVISALQSIVARNVAPLQSAVITIGKISGGERYNVLAGRVEMEGTCRNLNPAVQDMIEGRMESIIRGVAEGMGARYTFRYIRGYSPIVNAQEMVELVCAAAEGVVGKTGIEIKPAPSMGGEDFSFYAEKVPGAFYRLGCHTEGTPVWPSHNEHLVVDTTCFPVGMRVMAESALNYLAKK